MYNQGSGKKSENASLRIPRMQNYYEMMIQTSYESYEKMCMPSFQQLAYAHLQTSLLTVLCLFPCGMSDLENVGI